MNTRSFCLLLLLAPAGLLVFACTTDYYSLHDGQSTRISISDGDASVRVKRSGYSLILSAEGEMSFKADESDLATLEAGGKFNLSEKLDGVLREYEVRADRSGQLTREYFLEGKLIPLDAAAQDWLAAALPRMFRESGFDAEARVGRLLARGGPELVLQEANLTHTDYAKVTYLRLLLEQAELGAAQAERALLSAAQIDSDYELSQVLQRSLKSLPAGAAPQAGWLTAARQLDSDYELGQAIHEALKRCGNDESFATALVGLAAEQLESDYELGQVLQRVAKQSMSPARATAYLTAAGELGSDYERRCALEEFAPSVAADPDLNRRYRELSRSMGDYDRGQALKALDDATRD
jgi:hypothetical protein